MPPWGRHPIVHVPAIGYKGSGTGERAKNMGGPSVVRTDGPHALPSLNYLTTPLSPNFDVDPNGA
jgi:hypothetical protein